jgi:hypothetical protein
LRSESIGEKRRSEIGQLKSKIWNVGRGALASHPEWNEGSKAMDWSDDALGFFAGLGVTVDCMARNLKF